MVPSKNISVKHTKDADGKRPHEGLIIAAAKTGPSADTFELIRSLLLVKL